MCLEKEVPKWSRSRSLESGQIILKMTKEEFLGNRGDKEFVVKGYIDASLNTDPEDYESKTG